MKTSPWIPTSLVGTLMCLVSALSLTAAEPRDDAKGRGKGAPAEREGGFRGRPDVDGSRIREMIENLPEAAREAMREMFGNSRELAEQAREAREALGKVMFAEKLDEQVIREKFLALAKIEADLAVVRARAFAKLKDSGMPEEALNRMRQGFLMGQGGPGAAGFRGGPGGPEGLGGRPREGGDQPGFRGRPEGRPSERKPATDNKPGDRRPEFDK